MSTVDAFFALSVHLVFRRLRSAAGFSPGRHSPLGFSDWVSRTFRRRLPMHAPPLVAFAGGACPATAASPSPWLASPRAGAAILAAPARLLRSRRGALRLEAKAAWRAAGGGRGPRVPAKGAVLASYMGAEEVVGPSSLLDEEGSVCCCCSFEMQSALRLYCPYVFLIVSHYITAFASLSTATSGALTLVMKAQLPS